MDASIAEQAIKYHLDIPQSKKTITFYGRGYLWEFDLIRHLVLLAEKRCRSINKDCNSLKNCGGQSSCVNLSENIHATPLPEFFNWTNERLVAFQNGYNDFLSSLLTSPTEEI
jgi:hypothetical protein